MPIVASVSGGSLERQLSSAERSLELLVVDHHYDTLRAGDCALPWCANVPAIALGEIFDTSHGQALGPWGSRRERLSSTTSPAMRRSSRPARFASRARPRARDGSQS